VKRILGRTLLALLAALAVVYVSDWVIWRVRMIRGTGMASVSIGTVIVTPLKGNKEEYDWGGTVSLDCSRSLFPHAGSGACWWLRRQKVVYDR